MRSYQAKANFFNAERIPSSRVTQGTVSFSAQGSVLNNESEHMSHYEGEIVKWLQIQKKKLGVLY
jgi:hypothetical protein